MKKLIPAILTAVLALALSACASQETGERIGIRGEVTGITTEKGFIVLQVEGKVEEDTDYDKASVTVDADTKVITADDKQTPADMLDIALFDVVEVVFDGPVAESYPVQGKAKLVRILED